MISEPLVDFYSTIKSVYPDGREVTRPCGNHSGCEAEDPTHPNVIRSIECFFKQEASLKEGSLYFEDSMGVKNYVMSIDVVKGADLIEAKRKK